MVNTYSPTVVSCPGDTFGELLMMHNISIDEFSRGYLFSLNYLMGVLKGDFKMTPRLMGALCEEFGTPPLFWVNREENYWNWKNSKEVKND